MRELVLKDFTIPADCGPVLGQLMSVAPADCRSALGSPRPEVCAGLLAEASPVGSTLFESLFVSEAKTCTSRDTCKPGMAVPMGVKL